jgi:hypothetical protein
MTTSNSIRVKAPRKGALQFLKHFMSVSNVSIYPGVRLFLID